MSDSIYVIRKSFPLLVIKIIVSELLLECIYVGYRVIVFFLGITEINLLNVLNNLGTIVFIAVSLIQITLFITFIMSWLGDKYELHPTEIIHRTGFLNKKTESFLYTNIQQVITKQSFIERFTNSGQVRLFIPALGHDVVFRDVPSPEAFAELIRNKMPQGAGTSRILLQRR